MKAKELMIGDWVLSKSISEPCKVVGIDPMEELGREGYTFKLKGPNNILLFVHAVSVEPIPLTPEILEKNGWERSADHLWRHDDAFSLENDFEKGYWVHLFDSPVIYLTSVHELQHALRFFKIEKEIIL